MIVVQTPLRLSFVGGGTDFEEFYSEHGGAVVSSAIDKCVFVIVKERFDDLICVNYTRREVVEQADEVKHDLVREALKVTGVNRGVEITTLADIPSEGSGLGSSSSITVGLLHALHTHNGETPDAERLARQACHIEIDRLGSPIGRQDQFIAAYGGLRFISFNRNGVTVERVNIPPATHRMLSENLLLYYSGVTRKATDVLTEQKANIGQRVHVLREMTRLAYQARDALVSGDLDAVGRIMDSSWELKKQLASKVSNDHIDEILATAKRAGALGGKVTGAGGGGFVLLYCRGADRNRVRAALHGLRELHFGFERDGSKVIFNYRRNH